MRRHLTFCGFLIGLAVGIIMFRIALLPSFGEGTILYGVYDVLNRPVLWLVGRIHQTFHGPGLYELLTAFVLYWGLLGFLGGCIWRRFCARRHAPLGKATGKRACGPTRFQAWMHWTVRVAQNQHSDTQPLACCQHMNNDQRELVQTTSEAVARAAGRRERGFF